MVRFKSTSELDVSTMSFWVSIPLWFDSNTPPELYVIDANKSQFHYGSIQIISKAIDRLINSDGLNSTMVRFK